MIHTPAVLLPLLLAAAPASLDIKVDQVGYAPDAPKVAMVASRTAASRFTIRRAGDGSVAFEGTLTAPTDDPDSGDRVQSADFSRLTSPGRYRLEVPGVGESWEFGVSADVYARAFYLAMRSFYGQRCGTAVGLGPAFPGYAHAACHLDGAFHASSGRTGPRLPSGGWHDAGDYGRYVVNSGISTGTLLWTFELFGARVRNVRLDIPESGGATPDLLSEVRWNLDWMLSMQDEDGGVWHKQTSETFCAFVMPEKDALTSYVIGAGSPPFKSSCATADFAAVMAVAARVYEPFDAAFAGRCLRAARQAWTWLEAHPDVTFKNPAGVATGEYGDRDCADEHLWAAAELFRTTGDAAFDRYVADHAAPYVAALRTAGPPAWPRVASLGLWTYALAQHGDAGLAETIRRESLGAADAVVARTAANGYKVSLVPSDYVWGSNGVVANYGLQLLVANALRKDARYAETALDDLHYLLGRNAFSLSFVTQVGANPFRHPHHRPSGADANAEPWPGLLSGGPNRARQDPAMQSLGALPPARMYLDEEASYATNEIAINWNAPLVFLLAAALPEGSR